MNTESDQQTPEFEVGTPEHDSYWIAEMQKILDKEREKGLLGVHITPREGSTQGQIARAFCIMEKAHREGHVKVICHADPTPTDPK